MSNPRGRGIKRAITPAPTTDMKTYKLKRRAGAEHTSDRLLESVQTEINGIISNITEGRKKSGFGKSEFLDEWFYWSPYGRDYMSMANHLFTVEVPKLRQVGWTANPIVGELGLRLPIADINLRLKIAFSQTDNVTPDAKSLGMAFTWNSTKEGYEYWSLLSSLITLEPLMEECECA